MSRLDKKYGAQRRQEDGQIAEPCANEDVSGVQSVGRRPALLHGALNDLSIQLELNEGSGARNGEPKPKRQTPRRAEISSRYRETATIEPRHRYRFEDLSRTNERLAEEMARYTGRRWLIVSIATCCVVAVVLVVTGLRNGFASRLTVAVPPTATATGPEATLPLAHIPTQADSERRREKKRNSHYQRGMRLIRQKKIMPAIEELEKAVAIDPRHAESYRALGMVNSAIGREKSALASYRRFVKLAPNHPDAAKVRRILAE